MNTTVTIKYANGETREFVASDKLEECINKGEMFSVTTMHSDISITEEMQVSKMYVGNPVAAMGHMMMMHRNAQNLRSCKSTRAILEVLTTCINLMKNEITSHQSGMSPCGDVTEDVGVPVDGLNDLEDEVGEGQYRCEMCGGVFDKGWSDEEACEEADANGLDPDECGICCDDCYKKTPYYTPPEVTITSTGDVNDRLFCHVIDDFCDFYSNQLDRNDEIAIEHCSHPDNPLDEEGNCTSTTCPRSTDFIPF